MGPSYPPGEGPWYWEEPAPQVCLQDEDEGCEDHGDRLCPPALSWDKASGIWRLELWFWKMGEGWNLGDEDSDFHSDLHSQELPCTQFLHTYMFVFWKLLILNSIKQIISHVTWEECQK